MLKGKIQILRSSFQTIFYILPRLSGLVEDEWIAIDKFTRFTDLPPAAGLQGYLCPTPLRDLRPGDWAQQDTGKRQFCFILPTADLHRRQSLRTGAGNTLSLM